MVISIGCITPHPLDLEPAALNYLVEHALGYLVFGGKCLFFRDMAFLTQLGIIPAEPFLWDVQFIIHKPISFVPGVGKEHPGLAVFRFPQAATVLPFYPGGMLPFFLQSLCHPRTTCRSLPQSAWTGAPGRYPEGAAHQKGNG